MTTSPLRESLAQQIAFLKTAPLFADLDDAKLQTILSTFRFRRYAKNDIIFRQGDMGHELYLIRAGKVRIFRLSHGGQETSFTIFAAGDVIGEFAAVDGLPRSATARALEACELWEMPQARFQQHMQTMPEFAMALAQLLVAKVRWTASYAEAVARYDAAGRLLHILLVYNQQFGKAVEDGKRYELDLALNQDDLASLVGARREWVNRILQQWKRRGLVEWQAGKIIILDLPAVQHERDQRIEADPS